MATVSELEAKLKLVQAERDDLAQQLSSIREQFSAVKRAFLSARSKEPADPRIAEMEVEMARLKQEFAAEKARLESEIAALKANKPRKAKVMEEEQPPLPADPEPAAPGPDPRQILRRLANEE